MKTFTLTLILLFSTITYAQQSEFIFHNLGSKHGLTYSAVRDIVQDNNGYIWIATLKGLNRYDGYNIKQFYKSKDGLSSNCIERMALIGKDSLLLGTNEGLCLYDVQKETFSSIPSPDNNHLYVSDMVENETKVFVASTLGLHVYDKHSQNLKRLFKGRLLQISLDINGNIWGVASDTIYCFRSNGHSIRKYAATEVSPQYSIQFSAIYRDSQGTIWLGTTEDGLYRYNKSREAFLPVTLASQNRKTIRYIRCLREDTHGNLWIGTENGLFIYDYTDDSYKHYLQDSNLSQTGLTDNAIYSIFKSREEIMWVGSFFGGVNYTSLTDNKFNYILSDNGKQALKGKAISNIIRDSKGSLWLASEDNGISIIHPDQSIHHLNKSTSPKLNGNNVHALVEDPSGNIWAGNFVDGLQKIDWANRHVQSYKNMTGDNAGLSDNSIYKLYIHNTDSMFIGTSTGIDIYHFKNDQFTRFLPHIFKTIRVDDILRDAHNCLWFSTHFDGVFMYNPATRKITQYRKSKEGCEGIISDNIYCSFMDSKKRIWFGTSNGGLMSYNYSKNCMEIFGKDNELKQRDIYSIQEDLSGLLWMSTDNGIFCFNPDNKSFTHYQVSDNLISNQFNACSGYRDTDGTIYFGSINGVCFFHPEELNQTNITQNIHITFSEFKIFNKHVQPDKNGILKNNIDNTSDIDLEHDMNTLTFDFLIINYNDNYQSQFVCEYRLEGIEENWNTAQQMPQSITYTLPPGKYKFHVRVIHKNGAIIEQREINVHIHPHFLASKLMIAVYFMIGICMAYIIIRFYRTRIKDKMDIKIERMEKNNLRELNKHKLNFFTFITHEFKTPLSILMAIFEDVSIGKERQLEKEEVNIIKRNIQRLQFLINQLLDFRSVETDHARIEYVKADIMSYGKAIFDLFTPVFKQKQIRYQYQSNPEAFYTIFDQDKIEKIISNLLSNAFKHSDAQSEINFSIRIDEDTDRLILSCQNSSSYIHPEQREAVLQPFHKTGSKDTKYSNTGIGLALVNGLVQLLSGTIDIESKQETGTTFIIQLPLVKDTKNVIVPDKKPNIVNSPDIVADTVYMLDNSIQEENINYQEKEKKLSVLLVDDNPDINRILKSKLCKIYKVKSAYDGREAVEILKNHIIDIVISDIMMPFMDGYDLSKYIKTSHEYSHIPVILITSQPSKENELQGLSAGADAYIEKPFTFDELNLRITNLLKAKSNIRAHYQDMKIFELNEKLNNKDEVFIHTLTQYILEHIQEPDLNVNQLVAHMQISRTHLYNKLKKLLNLSITEFINKIKIDVAKLKIIETNLSFAEISWQLGFNNPSYFSKTFKRFAGMTPNEFKNNREKNVPIN